VTRSRTALAALALVGTSLVPATLTHAEEVAAVRPRPDVACLRAGVRTLISAGLLADVARNGLPIADAVALGVTPRPGTDVASLPDPLPLAVVLVDHLAGDRSLFIYPWCD
jgi:hypothetical protein